VNFRTDFNARRTKNKPQNWLLDGTQFAAPAFANDGKRIDLFGLVGENPSHGSIITQSPNSLQSVNVGCRSDTPKISI
jgi:hypothetical protein